MYQCAVKGVQGSVPGRCKVNSCYLYCTTALTHGLFLNTFTLAARNLLHARQSLLRCLLYVWVESV
jgi:hypothetical protein